MRRVNVFTDVAIGMIETNPSPPIKSSNPVTSGEESLSLLHNFPTPVWRSGLDGQCDYFNNVWLNFTGRPLKDELGDGWLHAVHPEEVERVIREYRTAFDRREPFTLEYRLQRHDGKYRNFVDHGQPYTQPDGTFAGYIGSCYDITERLEVEQSLRETETRFRQLAENINAVFWLCLPDMSRIDYVSPAFEKIWGRTCGSLYKDPRSWLDSIHVEDRERVVLAMGHHSPTVQFDETFRIVRGDGSIRWIRDQAFPVTSTDGKLVRIAGIAEDITEMIQADDTIRTLLRISFNLNSTLEAEKLMEFLAQEAIELIGTESGWAGVRKPEGIVVRSYLMNGTILPLDCCWPRGFGLAGWQFEHQKPYVTNDAANDPQINPEMRERFGIRAAMNVPIICSKGKLLGCLQVNNKKDGTDFTPSDVGKLVSVAETASVALQNALAFQKLKENETEASETNEKLRLLTKRLLNVQEDERRNLAYKLHDEVGQTLSAVKIGLEAAQKSCDRPTEQSQLDNSVLLVDQVLKQVRQIALDLRPSMLDHLGLVPALRWYFDQQSQRSELRIDFQHGDLQTTIPAEVQTACYRIAQEAVTNILRHAVAKNVSVEMRESNGMLAFSITDDGVGFNFEQSKLRASLGLLGMKERAVVSGGSLEVISQPTKGTTILVRLPLGRQSFA